MGDQAAAVVVVPAGVDDLAGGQDLRVVVVDLVEAKAADELAVGIAAVEVGDRVGPAVDELDAAGRAEDDVAIGKVDSLDVGDADRIGELADLAGGELHLVEVVVIRFRILLPGEEEFLAIPGDVGIADRPFLVGEQGFDPAEPAVVQAQAAEGAAGILEIAAAVEADVAGVVPAGLVAGDDWPVGIVDGHFAVGPGDRAGMIFGDLPETGMAGIVAFEEDDLAELFLVGCEALAAAGLAGLLIELEPGDVAGRGPGIGEFLQFGGQRLAGVAKLGQHPLDQAGFITGVGMAEPGMEIAAQILRARFGARFAEIIVLQEPVGLMLEFLPGLLDEQIGLG
jgi:hypothetical protein